MIRRPDVVIVKDAGHPPIQDNIKQIVEMKFPPDPPDRGQAQDYAMIAGGEDYVAVMESTECNCSSEDEQSKIPVAELGWAAAVASALMFMITRGRSPRPMMPAY